MPADYPILSAPRISATGFRDVLRRHRSPAAGAAAACYAAFVAAGVDPAVGLAIFQHESGFGRAGIATGNRSWGNIRGPGGHFTAYPSWTAGAAALAALLVVYGHNRIRPGTKTSTVLTFSYVYAPSADHNDPHGYGRAVQSLVTGWAAAYPPRARRVTAAGLRFLYGRTAGGVTRLGPFSGLHFSANVGPATRLLLAGGPSTGGRFTFARILTGSHRGRYVHVGDPALTFTG